MSIKMYGTIEGTHIKICEKIATIEEIFRDMSKIIKKNNLLLNVDNKINELKEIEINYNLATVSIFSDYYESKKNETKNTKEYYRLISGENITINLQSLIDFSKIINNNIYTMLISHKGNLNKDDSASQTNNELEAKLEKISKYIDKADSICINTNFKKCNYEFCNCGTRMSVIPETSEMQCDNPQCGKTKTIIGVVFRDDQFYPQEGQKSKYAKYDTTRHYKFWIDRLQAIETKEFDEKDLKKIEYVIKRDNYKKYEINCKLMREILKDPAVNMTYLNDHSPLLMKIFGGRPPPQLENSEDRILSIRFNKVVKLYDEINPNGGNKPYYPYFIYKILEHMFKGNPEKLRFLDYIHLQSRETVIKNDNYFKEIAKLCSKQDGIVYTPTDPAGRLD